MAYHSQHSIDADTRIGDGFVDGGRGMKIRPDGSVSSSREILTVDRTRDAELRKELEFARSRELAKLDPLERAARIGRRVTEIYRGNPAADSKALESERRNQEVLIGDVAKITGNQGVCRHRSLLFKLLAPMRNVAAIENCARGIDAMAREEAAYWLGMAMHRKNPRRVLAALRLLLSAS